MKKPYQIEAQRAVKQLEAMAADGNPAVQMVLPMAEMVGGLRKGVGELIRQAGLQLMDLLLQQEVRGLARVGRQGPLRVSACCSRTYRPSTRVKVPAARGWPLPFSRMPSEEINTSGFPMASFTMS